MVRVRQNAAAQLRQNGSVKKAEGPVMKQPANDTHYVLDNTLLFIKGLVIPLGALALGWLIGSYLYV